MYGSERGKKIIKGGSCKATSTCGHEPFLLYSVYEYYIIGNQNTVCVPE